MGIEPRTCKLAQRRLELQTYQRVKIEIEPRTCNLVKMGIEPRTYKLVGPKSN
jgi:hypothetical protein